MNQAFSKIWILIILLIIVIGAYLFIFRPEISIREGGRSCVIDDDCVVFGKTGDCNCGCYNKNYLPIGISERCFCAVPKSCKCVDGTCEGVFVGIADETFVWKTYRNDEYGFEVKYPTDWTAKSINNRSLSFYKIDAPRDFYGNPVFPIIVTIKNNPQQLPIDQWIEQNKKELILSEKESIIIGGISGVKFIEAGMVECLAVYVGKEVLVYNIYTDKDSAYLTIFNQILSTFKFLE